MRVRMLALCLLIWPHLVTAQGFSGLGASVDGYAQPDPAPNLQFPGDHGAHPDFRIEWWYLTATLSGADGLDYGVQWTLFRTALAPDTDDLTGWASPQIWLGHAALTSVRTHLFAQRLSRGGIGTAGVTASPFTAWIDDWQMTSRAANGTDELSSLLLSARGTDFRYALELEAQGPLVLHGQDGYSVKSPDGQASLYYSQPHFTVRGEIETADGPVAVTGEAWLDREWSSQPLSREQQGWDWFALSFDTGEKLMAARVRSGDEAGCPRRVFGLVAGKCPEMTDVDSGFTFGTWIDAKGDVSGLGDGDIRLTPLSRADVAGRQIPVRWQMEVPLRALSVEVEALNPNSWMGTAPPYWEGPVAVSGSHTGRGYMEMTGYEPHN